MSTGSNAGGSAGTTPLPGVGSFPVLSTIASGKSIAAYHHGDASGQVLLKNLGTMHFDANHNPVLDPVTGNPEAFRPIRATVSKPQVLGGFTITRVGP